MAEIKFETGLVSYNVNGKIDISFNPTDATFVEKLYSAFEELDKLQETLESTVGETDAKNLFDAVKSLDAQMRDKVDGVFGAPVCAALFGDMNVFAFADGLPVWCNFMLAVMEETQAGFVREEKKLNPRIEKYVAKYRKK